MNRILKYKLEVTAKQTLIAPKFFTVLGLQLQNGTPTLWLLANPKWEQMVHTIEIYGTGHDVPHANAYIGTVQMPDGYVWHYFQVIETIVS